MLTISPIYSPPKVVDLSIRQYYKTTKLRTKHVLIDQLWPLDREEMQQVLESLQKDFGCVILRPGKNLGLARGLNWVLEQEPNHDYVIPYDPDTYPVTDGWDLGLYKAMEALPDVGWASIWNPFSEREIITEKKGYSIYNGEAWVLNQPVLNSNCMWRGEWLRKCKGPHEVHPYYGGTEVHTWKRLAEHNYKWIFLTKYHEQEFPKPELLNEHYKIWKFNTCHLGEEQIEFGDWLKKKGLL